MKAYERRIATLQAIVAGSVISGYAADATAIDQELAEAASAVRIPQANRKRLLQVLHTTRSLDSALKRFLSHHAVSTSGQSLGSYLTALKRNTAHTILAPLPEARRSCFQLSIVDVRNRYMHEAGSYPATEGEIMQLLSEMHTCLTEVFAL